MSRYKMVILKRLSSVIIILSLIITSGGIGYKAIAEKLNAKEKKAVMIIAKKGFRDEELQLPKAILESGGVEVIIASSSLEPAIGMLGSVVKPDILINDIKVVDYDAIIFIGGIGAMEYWDSPVAHVIAKKAAELDKVIGAICIAPVTLANAGVLSGKEATVWWSEAGKLKAKGAIYTGKQVHVDGKIVTANGPGTGEEFGKLLLDTME